MSGVRNERDAHSLEDSMAQQQKQRPFLTGAEYGRSCGVSHTTVARWVKSGLLPGAQQVAPRSHIRIPVAWYGHLPGSPGAPVAAMA